jgi:hypothetical protein
MTTFLRVVVTAFLMLSVASVAASQSAYAQGPAGDSPPAQGGSEIDVSRLPIDLERIHRELQESSIREERDGLNLRYVVSVYGQAPPIVIFGPDDDLVNGPVPSTAPTHKDMIEHVTPKEYRAPAADLGALARWLAERAKK